MRCLSCQKLSLNAICAECHGRLFRPTVSTRRVGTLDVISLFKYRNIAPFLLSKHTPTGYRLYRYLARRQVAPFLEAFAEGLERKAYLIGIDESPRSGYSHIAVLTHYGRVAGLQPLHASLIAGNRVDYSGKSLQFRLQNPRDFRYHGPSGIDAVLIDDIVTTGSTLGEAYRLLQASDVNVLFALTLADARD